MKQATYKKIANSIVETLNMCGELEFGELSIRTEFVSTAVREVLSDLLRRDIVVRVNCGTKPYIGSVMLRNVYKYKVKTPKP